MVEGGAVLQGQMLKEGLCEAQLGAVRRGAVPSMGKPHGLSIDINRLWMSDDADGQWVGNNRSNGMIHYDGS